MREVTVETDGESRTLAVVGNWPDYESVVEAHGFDPEADEWSVDDPDGDLHEAIQNASSLKELKSALTDSEHPAKSRGRGR